MVNDKLRRQGVYQGLVFGFLGLMVVTSAVIDSHQRAAVKAHFEACVSRQFTELTASLNQRTTLVNEDSASKTLVILTVAKSAGKPDADSTTAKALAQFVVDQATLQDRLAKAKIPPYPNGKCQ